jgi:amino acid transporter
MTGTAGDEEERHRLTAVQGLAALSLDALSSVAYGPEAILVVLIAAGAAGLRYSLPVTGAILVLLAALVVSYRQVIAAFPSGGGAYAVSKAHLGTQASLVAAASLIVTTCSTPPSASRPGSPPSPRRSLPCSAPRSGCAWARWP